MGNDVFGIVMMKPTKSGGETWTMNNSNFESDSRVYVSSGSGFSTSGIYQVPGSSSFRLLVSPSSGYDDSQCEQDQQKILDRGQGGYMQNPSDWKNVEFTAEFKVINSASDDVTIGFRGARHTGSGGLRGCTGSNYKVEVAIDGSGRIRVRKESWHVSYHSWLDTNVSGFDSTAAPFRLKVLIWNSQDNASVNIEVWLDQNLNNNFVKVLSGSDTGQVSSDADTCNCTNKNQPITWGSPGVLFRGDAGKFGWANATIREIDYFGTSGGGGTGGTNSGGYTVSAVTASGDDGTNVAANTRDANFNTRWSNFGKGSWIKYDLGAAHQVDTVKIAWYQGDQRTNNYVIDVSTDNTTWTNKLTGTSTATSTGLQDYKFASISCRYIRITVNGNSQNDWASITEVQIWGTDPTGGGSGTGSGTGSTTTSYHRMKSIFSVDYQKIGLCNAI